jgi:hypothetical protein
MNYAGEYKLAIQIGQRGFYARVWLTVSPDPSLDFLKIEVAQDARHAPMDFQAAIRAGIDTAWRRVRRADPSIAGLHVREVHLHYMIVDSTPRCVTYAAAGALLNVLGLERLLPPFQPDATLDEMIAAFSQPSQDKP